MNERYQIVSTTDTDSLPDSKELASLLAKEGQLILPFLDLIEQAQVAIDDLVDVMGRATIEAVLQMSAAQLIGPKQQGKKTDRDVAYHGTQRGCVALKERQLHVTKPRLRKRQSSHGESGEVEIPAYAALQKDGRLAARMLDIMMAGVSTRRYETVLPEMAAQCGISKSQVSREFIEAGARLLKDLAERDFSETDILVVYVDGLQFGGYHVICAVGVDDGGHKHVLGFREGATENAEVATALLEDLTQSRPLAVPQAAVRHRRLESAPQGHRPSLREGEPGPALSQSQGAQCAGPSAEGSARSSESDDESRLQNER
jgi:putative transposase